MERKTMTTPEREVSVWDPLREFRGLTGMSELFDDLLGGIRPFQFPTAPRAWTPKVDIQETDKEYVMKVSLPGVKKEDVKVSVEEGVLNISGERHEEKEEKGKSWVRRESAYGSFSRSFVLPSGMHPEELKAAHKDGVLIVTLRKPEQPKSREVNVKVE
ncbi:MAG: Hsp20/alpha crystallin family protein [Elusimicrobia bacterium]|nr:Hsp20/alpha crystallin family protein [Elusimicrobiota bacterium]